jgi:hypothetical protein
MLVVPSAFWVRSACLVLLAAQLALCKARRRKRLVLLDFRHACFRQRVCMDGTKTGVYWATNRYFRCNLECFSLATTTRLLSIAPQSLPSLLRCQSL